MSNRVKRGLGLLVVALIAYLVALVLSQIDVTGGAMTWVMIGVSALVVLAFIGGLLGGLALLAWGLLRD